MDWQQLDVAQIGWRIVNKNQKQYVGEQVAEWKLDLEPRAMHFDKRVTVTSPLEKAGAYLVTAKVADGNEVRSILWLADTVIVKKPLAGKSFVYVADAVTGAPVPKANVEFFGYRWKEVEVPIFGRRAVVETKNFAEFTDADGQIQHDFHDPDRQYQWLSIARTDDGRLAHYGFDTMWHGQRYDEQYNEVKTFGITDRPVYRPNQRVQFKFWIRQAKYDVKDDENNRFADQAYNLELTDPQGTSAWKQQLRSDKYGGLAGEYELPSDAKLGMYNLRIDGYGR
ncbi:MAG: MG2 domain-containing protein [Pirellulales bacterium]